MEIVIQDQKIDLLLDEHVFTPSPHAIEALGSAISIKSGESVLDLGTGTGFLAILAAQKGGRVTATDISMHAVDLAAKNAERNHVSLDVRQGDLFEPVKHRIFDVIIANIAQEVLSPALQVRIHPDMVRATHAGENGNELLLKILKEAPGHMHAVSRLYVMVHAMAHYHETLAYLISHYDARLVNFYSGPVKSFVYDDLSWYEDRMRQGKMNFYQKNGSLYADLLSFELRLPGSL